MFQPFLSLFLLSYQLLLTLYLKLFTNALTALLLFLHAVPLVCSILLHLSFSFRTFFLGQLFVLILVRRDVHLIIEDSPLCVLFLTGFYNFLVVLLQIWKNIVALLQLSNAIMSFLDLDELILRFFVALIFVRMILKRHVSILLLNLHEV